MPHRRMPRPLEPLTAHDPGPSAEDPGPASAAAAPSTVTVAPGDTLWDLAAQHGGDGARWRELHEANAHQLPDPSQLAVGMTLQLPSDWTTGAPAPPSSATEALAGMVAPHGPTEPWVAPRLHRDEALLRRLLGHEEAADHGPTDDASPAAPTPNPLRDAAQAWSEDTPRRTARSRADQARTGQGPGASTSWSGWCASLMVRFGDGTGSATEREHDRFAPSAWLASQDSSVESTEVSEAPRGAYHWWATPGGGPGHVALDLSGGGEELFMASRHVTEVWGEALGTVSFETYQAATGLEYLGWSRDYMGNGIDPALLAADPERADDARPTDT